MVAEVSPLFLQSSDWVMVIDALNFKVTVTHFFSEMIQKKFSVKNISLIYFTIFSLNVSRLLFFFFFINLSKTILYNG
jgi:hypothetical protein